jgi:hypothetical protein
MSAKSGQTGRGYSAVLTRWKAGGEIFYARDISKEREKVTIAAASLRQATLFGDDLGGFSTGNWWADRDRRQGFRRCGLKETERLKGLINNNG